MRTLWQPCWESPSAHTGLAHSQQTNSSSIHTAHALRPSRRLLISHRCPQPDLEPAHPLLHRSRRRNCVYPDHGALPPWCPHLSSMPEGSESASICRDSSCVHGHGHNLCPGSLSLSLPSSLSFSLSRSVTWIQDLLRSLAIVVLSAFMGTQMTYYKGERSEGSKSSINIKHTSLKYKLVLRSALVLAHRARVTILLDLTTCKIMDEWERTGADSLGWEGSVDGEV